MAGEYREYGGIGNIVSSNVNFSILDLSQPKSREHNISCECHGVINAVKESKNISNDNAMRRCRTEIQMFRLSFLKKKLK